MWRLEVSGEAELEIFEAALRYERERGGLGFRFEAQVNTVFTGCWRIHSNFQSSKKTSDARSFTIFRTGCSSRRMPT